VILEEKEQLAYLAGLIDGEGSIIIHRYKSQYPKNRGNGRKSYPDKTPRFVVDVTISMTDKSTVNWIKTFFGGHVAVRQDRRKPTYRTIYRWGLRANKAVALTKKVRPYLITKARQADLIIFFQENLIRKTGWKGDGIQPEELALREHFYKLNKLLNQGRDTEMEEKHL
jgi:hypothetical protein